MRSKAASSDLDVQISSDSDASTSSTVLESQVLDLKERGSFATETRPKLDPDELDQSEARQLWISRLADALTAEVRAAERRESTLAAHATSSSRQKPRTAFHGSRTPPIPVRGYLDRIATHSQCSPVCFIMAYTYIQRLAEKEALLKPCGLNIHRLVITGITVATKLVDDKFFSNAFYAKVGGISNKELNRLELDMLARLDYRAYVSEDEISLRLKLLQDTEPDFVTDSSVARRSKKRVNESFGSGLHPAKCQHDDKHNEVLVAPIEPSFGASWAIAAKS